MNSRTHIKTKKTAIFERTNLKMNMPQIKNIVKLMIILNMLVNIEVLDII